MQINKLISTFLILSLTWFVSVTAHAASATQSDPVALLQYIANNMIAGLKSNQATLKTKPGVVYNLAYKYVVPYADLAAMSKRVLPPQTWNNATPAQRAQFQKEFTKTLIRTYASALTSYKDQTIRFYPVRGGYANASSVEVNSQISSPSSQPMRVTYRLIRTGNAWRLVDMSVEGVNMLDSFRAQFADIAAQGDMQQLLNRLSQHNRR